MNKTIYKSNQAYEYLEEMITFQDLSAGEMYSESKLVELTGLGRSPIREALQKLTIDKLVEIFPSKGILITPISVETQVRLLEVRRNVGEFAMRLAAQRATNDDKKIIEPVIEGLLQIKNYSQIKELVALLRKTHSATVMATKNEFVDSVLSPLQSLSRRFWVAHLNQRDEELVTVANLYANKLRFIHQNDADSTIEASLKINDYFTKYTYQILSQLKSMY